MKAIGYLRVSTDRQGDSGAGLDAQRASITAYAAQHGIEIVRFEQDILSGAKGIEHRLGLASAIASIQKGYALLIAKRDRLGRDRFGQPDRDDPGNTDCRLEGELSGRPLGASRRSRACRYGRYGWSLTELEQSNHGN